MQTLANPFKLALRQKRLQLGLWQALASPYSAEICAGSEFDWLLFDGEHAPNDVPSLLAQLQAVAAYPVHAVGRPPVGDAFLIKQYLDIGFTSLLIPLVETAEQATDLVRAVRYPPLGKRGVGSALARASRWNRIPSYLRDADEQICLLLQVETVRGLENLNSIAETDGVDGVFIGPADLSAALAHRGDPQHPEVQDAIERAVAIVGNCGKAPGIIVANSENAQKYARLGCTFIAVGSDIGVLSSSTADLLNRTRAFLLEEGRP
jgi:4-hydroxy-2-oxoheptanedioate aldolase